MKERARPLTSLGVKQAIAVAKRLKGDGEEPRVILASVYERTMQTADIYGKILGCPVNPCDELGPHVPIAEWIEKLVADDDEGRRVMLIGHHDNLDPFLAKYDEEPEAPAVLVKAEVRRYRADRGDCCLEMKYRVTPEDVGLQNLMGWRELVK